MIRVRLVRPLLAVLPLALTFVHCGGGANMPTTPPATTLPAPAPTPTPTPTPPPGSSDCLPGGDCSTNRAPVTRAQLRLYRLFDNRGGPANLPDPVRQVVLEPIPVGFTMLFDVTGRDKDNKETLGPTGDGTGIVWYLSDPSLVEPAGTPSAWQHKYLVKQAGKFKLFVTFDDVGSNDLLITFVACVPGENGCQP